MSISALRLRKARRSLRALFILGFFLAVLGTISAAVFLDLYFTRLPSATMPTWQFWQLMLFHDSLFLLIFIGFFFATRPLVKSSVENPPGDA